MSLELLLSLPLTNVFNGYSQAEIFASSGSGIYVPWASFAKLASSLVLAGFSLRCLALMRLAISGKENTVGLGLKLISSIIGIMVVNLFM